MRAHWGWILLSLVGCKPEVQGRPIQLTSTAVEDSSSLSFWTPGPYAWNGSWQSSCLSDHDDESIQKVWTFQGEQVQQEWQMFINDPCDTLGHTLRFRGTWTFSDSPAPIAGARGIRIHWQQMEITPLHEDVVTLFNEMAYCHTGQSWKLGETQVLRAGPCFFERTQLANQNQLIGLQDGAIYIGDDENSIQAHGSRNSGAADLPQHLERLPYRKTVSSDWR